MNFFKSILSDDLEPENTDNNRNFNSDSPLNHQQTEKSESKHTDMDSASSGEVSGSTGGSLWSFGDLVKTITTRSESVLETYRRDLKEFGSGLRKESDLFREVANRAVKDLPNSIEVGASAIDGVLKSTVEIISQGTDVVLEPSDADDSVNSVNSESVRSSRVYNRFESQLNAIQPDVRTYCDDPEDLDEYNKWKLGFVLSDMEGEIEKLIGGGGSVEEIYKKVVPNPVDDVSFWCRYFYRVNKLKQQEEMRAHFVRRALSVDHEEELSWDVDDEEDETRLPETERKHNSSDNSKTVTSNVVDDDHVNKNSDVAVVNMNDVPKVDQNREYSKNGGEDRLDDKNGVEAVKLSGGGAFDHQKVESVVKTDESLSDNQKAESVAKTDETLVCKEKSGKDLQADEDLEWDEIGDIGEDDEKHVVQGETAKKGEFLKRVNIAEDDEDLSWDIEDDDEPVKTTNAM
ncbi:putative BSD domain-containing protein [Helianthus annuus]|uniref:BSD domain-containing protein n=1 Tax=Helianthus annuus TaxID=4232 RepID=A0A251S5R8_HELAN|nr:BSD domain-containing protein 1 [Helianthus annuus]KAF5762905.1 putative BSD domain-containing protein [Helianthus annuus]KAJ0471616.1 putative BSD domain-containing protein [Helianthus annuus]KAJ0651132.1 putative BSD domain-containing protein [Helianthus annuus]